MKKCLFPLLLCAFFGSFSYSLSQNAYYEVPITTAFQTLGIMGDVTVVTGSLPETNAFLPSHLTGSANETIQALASAHGLCTTTTDSGVIVVSSTDTVCSPSNDILMPESETLLNASLSDTLPAPSNIPLTYELKVVSLNANTLFNAGIDWSSLFTTANLVSAGLSPVLDGYIGSSQLDNVITALESEGYASRLDTLTVRGLSSQPVVFNRGGGINVLSRGAGDNAGSTDVTTLAYGFSLSVTGEYDNDNVLVVYDFSDSAPVSSTDSQNVQIAETSFNSQAPVACGDDFYIGSFTTDAKSVSGDGLPGLSRVPYAGYAAGQGASSDSQTVIALTLGVQCG